MHFLGIRGAAEASEFIKNSREINGNMKFFEYFHESENFLNPILLKIVVYWKSIIILKEMKKETAWNICARLV